MTTNIIAFKLVQLFGIKFGAGTLMFPACLIVGDLTTEVYGFRRTRKVVVLSLVCSFAYMVFTQLAIWLPPAPEWKDQAVFSQVFGQAPRIFIAGAFAYLAGELSNSLVISRMKIRDNGKYFWRRAMASAIVGELANTSVFMSFAWAGKMGLGSLLHVILNGTLIKIVVQALVLPVTTALAVKFKTLEGVDHFDGPTGPAQAARRGGRG